ncbi:polysaccharide biosynthesis/export family protein [Albimonas sp. CAU 1670]|uniref:polysaccharide biosynthesis/export family protein n=1 Tax=Albimonas sp. CAU 1670 TaxID=3032599 RepID=UPI0023DB2590|nr:polysaccharide biosynthesis/export family protein [Albimonas sp. CAU 1670]MDF2233275.1 polysaccharide biosynthesis/export family protein [Albimonas sp. CAU 1670]
MAGGLLLALPASAQVGTPLSQSPSAAPAAQTDAATVRANLGLPESDDGIVEEGAPYKVRVGDRLAISVLEDPSLSTTALVLPDGRISLPIAGSVFVSGRSTDQIEKTLERSFAAGFSVRPTITVAVAGLAPLTSDDVLDEPVRFYVMGAMNRPGPIESDREITLLEAIAMAGGPSPFAATSRIQLRRRDENGVETVYLFDFERVEEGLPVENNEVIQEGDVIFAPERGLWD